MPELTRPQDRVGDDSRLIERFREERDVASHQVDELRSRLLAAERELLVMQAAGDLDFADSSDAWRYLKGAALSDDQWTSTA